MLEIERKFLVTSEAFKTEAFQQEKIVQGFLNSHPERTVRVRIKGEKGYLTVKGKSDDSGVSRFEWEKEVSWQEAQTLIKFCEPGIIEKTRFLVKYDGHTFEVDEFYGENQGLVVAEVELKSVDENFKTPGWLGREVTGNIKYYNSALSKTPFKNWKKDPL